MIAGPVLVKDSRRVTQRRNVSGGLVTGAEKHPFVKGGGGALPIPARLPSSRCLGAKRGFDVATS